ncbi:MAG: tetratricopeptide repeat protein [Dokdonella sp.]
MALAKKGQLGSAEQFLRQALLLLPAEASFTDRLARLILTQNRPTDALAAIDESDLTNANHTPELLLLRAQILLKLKRWSEAILAFNAAIQAIPENGSAELGLAVALGESGHANAAADAARRAIAKRADSSGARYVLGRALLASGQFDEAESEFRKALCRSPDDHGTRTALAKLLWMQTGNSERAINELNAGLRASPGAVELRTAKAKLLAAAGDVEKAMAELELGLKHAPNDAHLRVATAQIAIHTHPIRAFAHAKRAIEVAPRQPDALAIYGDALFAIGRIGEAASFAMRMLERDPDDNHATALLDSAWRALNDPRRHALCDHTRLVKASLLDTPPGWSSLSDYLQDLARSLHQSHRLNGHPIEQTLREGTQIDHTLACARDPVVHAFEQAIDGPIRRYMEALGDGADPFRRRNTGRYALKGLWSVRLRPHGHHLNHFHGLGWLSSACYIELPQSLGRKNGEGWLKFGEPAFGDRVDLGAEYFVKPQEGLLVLFPSSMWHGTVPFTGEPSDRRLTMAFDVVPA